MMRTSTGPVANAILRRIGALARIDGVDRQKPMMVVEAIRADDWASLTFVGQRHEFDLRLEGEAGAVAAALAVLDAELAESEIPLAGGFVAEIRLETGSCLTLDDPAQPGCVAQSLRIEALSISD